MDWKVNRQKIDFVQIWRSDDDRQWLPVARFPAAVVHFIDTGLTPDSAYVYRLSAAGALAPDGPDAAAVTVPNAPRHLTATPSDGDVLLSWSKVAGNSDGYEILGSADGKAFHVIGAVDADTTTYRDWAAADGVADYYEVCAFGLGGDSAPTNMACATPVGTIRAQDDTPDNNVLFSVAHGRKLTIKLSKLFANDADPNNDPILTLRSFTPPDHGTLVKSGDGALIYTADESYAGADHFTYTPTDQYNAPSKVATVQILVTDEMPEARSERMPVVEAVERGGNRRGGPGAVKGVLAVHDPDGDALTFSAKVVSGRGTFTLDDPSKGSYTFIPNHSDQGAVVVEFSASDGIKTSNKASLIFPGTQPADERPAMPLGKNRRNPVDSDRPPTAASRRFSVHQNGTLQVYASDGLLKDVNVAGQRPGGGGTLSVEGMLIEKPQHGAISINSDGSFLYTAASDFSGIDWFTWRVADPKTPGDYATTFIDVTPVVVIVSVDSLKPGDPLAQVPTAPKYATIHLGYPSDLPAGTTISLSIPGAMLGNVDVYDRVPGTQGSKLLFGKDVGESQFAWTVGGSPTPPATVYAVGLAPTEHDRLLFTLSVTLGQQIIGTPQSGPPASARATREPIGQR